MKFTSVILPITLLASVGAARSILSYKDQAVIAETYEVPGKNPLQFCDNPETYSMIEVTKVDLSPEKLEPGKNLTITAVGKVLETIEEGAYADVVVKIGLIKLLQKRFDLCEELRNNFDNVTCPLEKGEIKLKKEVTLPREIPPAKFTVGAVLYTLEDDEITCMTGSVDFSGFGFIDL